MSLSRKSAKTSKILVASTAICATAFLSLSACKQPEDVVTSNSTVTNPPAGVVDDSAGFYMRARASDNYTYYTHQGTSSSYNSSGSFNYGVDCVVAAGETDVTKRNILCYVEGEELDLYFNGVELQYNVPKSMCDYVKFSPPYYFKYPAGTGPSAVAYTLDGTATPPTYSLEENSALGTPICAYDYSNRIDPGPNCCYGKYSLTATTIDANGASASMSIGDWGGTIAGCLGGPAMATQTKSKSGFPMADILYVNGTGVNKVYSVASPLSQQFSGNIYVANYFNSTDYADTSTYQEPFNPPNVVPVPTPPGSTTQHTPYMVPTQPFFELTCLNRNHEALARIRLMVRSWDYTGFLNVAAAYDSTHGGNDGSGSNNGTEPDYGGAIHDFTIWPDVAGWGAGFEIGFPENGE